MTLSFDIRRAALLALSLVIAFAVVGPACFLFAESAFASHSHAPMSKSDRECGGPDGSSVVCPHANQVVSVQAVSAEQVHIDVALPATPAAVAAPSVLSAFTLAPSGGAPPGPVATLTPLRL